ncbi:NAD(P)H-dependent oxidoreductase [Bifidobacterium amazonense]|uniref:NAD(P)H-dependent oxidoreductase n=1 Tax=Bifidobacterium amazonense TaxID=2809027 RepID=A0ABS9VYA7_9BIFI|nr:flavodoxin [Bifidobacterium amazonense]MCH9276800.1 NAD(P)H-dependent oxidoreductase [Bifidobacterium amazonense]
MGLIAALAGCGGTTSGPSATGTTSGSGKESSSRQSDSATRPAADGKALIAYFSQTGNTKTVADIIAQQTGADEFRIEPATPYSDDYDTLLEVAQQEKQDDARPAIADTIDNLDDYDVIYLGTPIWWYEEPMIIRTFLDDYDLAGKTVAPFCTSGGSSCDRFVDSLTEREPDVTILDPLQVNGSSAADSADDVTAWLRDNRLI